MMACGNPLSKTRSVTFNQRCLVSAVASTNTCTLRGPGIVGEYRIGLGTPHCVRFLVLSATQRRWQNQEQLGGRSMYSS